MRKNGILNPALVSAITAAGHTQEIAICDAGTPLPRGARVIDLSLVPGIPAIKDVVCAVCAEMCVESYALAAESDAQNPEFVALMERELPGIVPERITHQELKSRLTNAFAIVRSGECSPYANVILSANVSW